MRLQVVGVPAPQGSKTRMPNGAMIEGSSTTGRANLKEWRRAVADEARRWLTRNPQPPLSGPLRITIEFRFPPTKSDPYRFWHAVKPDIDKIVRSTFDALKHGGLIADDCAVSALDSTKRFAHRRESSGCTIDITSLAGEEASIRETRKTRAAEARKRDRQQDALL